jgi:transcriptional regulator with XRE-family HTH domain
MIDKSVTVGVTTVMHDAAQNPVRSYRLRAGMKIRQLAEKWGTSFATLSRIENGTQRIPEKLLPVISRDTGAAVADLRPDLVERREELMEMLAEVPVQ